MIKKPKLSGIKSVKRMDYQMTRKSATNPVIKGSHNRPTIQEICSTIDTDLKEYHSKMKTIGKKVVVRKRSFEAIENEYQKNERDLQLFFKALRIHLANHSSIRIHHDPKKILPTAQGFHRNKPIDPNDRFYKGIMENIKKKEEFIIKNKGNRRADLASERIRNKGSSKWAESESPSPSRHEKRVILEEKYIDETGKFFIEEDEENEEEPSIKFNLLGKQVEENKKMEDGFTYYLKQLRKTLNQMYGDKNMVEVLCSTSPLLKLEGEKAIEKKARLRIEELKRITDGIYEKFFNTRRFVSLLKSKIDDYRMESGEIQKLLPIDTAAIMRILEKSSFDDQDDLSSPTLKRILRTQDRTDEIFFKKGINNRFKSINFKNINPVEKELEDYFNKKQILSCIDRKIVMQPIKSILYDSIGPLEYVKESKPLSKECVYDVRGRPILTKTRKSICFER